MKNNLIFLLFIAFLSAALKVSAQNGTTTQNHLFFERYATAWVKSEEGGYAATQKRIDTNKQLANLKAHDIRLYIPPNPNITMPNGNRYIRAYFVNNTQDPISIDRIDAALNDIETEIKVGNEWKLLQINMRSGCGNSYYSMELAPGKYLSLQINNNITGDIKVKYRIIAYAGKKRIISNEAYIYVSDELLKLAGSPIKQLSL